MGEIWSSPILVNAPPVFERLARRLHHHAPRARGHRVGNALLELERLGGGELRCAGLDAVEISHARKVRRGGRALERGLRIEDAPKIIRARGLSLGARERAQRELARRMVVGGIGDARHGAANIGDLDMGHRHLEICFRYIRHRARLDCLKQVFALERRTLADEQGIGAHEARIVGRVCNAQITRVGLRAHQHARPLEQIDIRPQRAHALGRAACLCHTNPFPCNAIPRPPPRT